MMYQNTRKGIIDEFTDKLTAEANVERAGWSADQNKRLNDLQEHFIRGMVCDLVDRIAEDPESFQFSDEEQ